MKTKVQFGAKTTAEEIASGHDLSGKVALVTGGNSGLGQETSRVLSLHGCRVIITSRKADAAEKAIKEMKEANAKVDKEGLPSEGQVSFVTMDLADLDTVKTGVDGILQQTTVVDYLILNAGVMACPYALTKNDLEMQIGTNHFGHFALTQQLLPRLSQPPQRVVALSSTGHRLGPIDLDDMHFTKGRKYDEWVSYGQSKLANILFAKEVNARAKGAYIAVSLHPGMIASTNLSRHMPAMMNVLWPLLSATGIAGLVSKFMFGDGVQKTIPQGAATTMWATLKDGVKGGEYCADCAVKEPSNPQAFDEELQKKFWEKTEEQLAQIEANGGKLPA